MDPILQMMILDILYCLIHWLPILVPSKNCLSTKPIPHNTAIAHCSNVYQVTSGDIPSLIWEILLLPLSVVELFSLINCNPRQSRGYFGFSPVTLPLQWFSLACDNSKTIYLRPFKFGMLVNMGPWPSGNRPMKGHLKVKI